MCSCLYWCVLVKPQVLGTFQIHKLASSKERLKFPEVFLTGPSNFCVPFCYKYSSIQWKNFLTEHILVHLVCGLQSKWSIKDKWRILGAVCWLFCSTGKVTYTWSTFMDLRSFQHAWEIEMHPIVCVSHMVLFTFIPQSPHLSCPYVVLQPPCPFLQVSPVSLRTPSIHPLLQQSNFHLITQSNPTSNPKLFRNLWNHKKIATIPGTRQKMYLI